MNSRPTPRIRHLARLALGLTLPLLFACGGGEARNEHGRLTQSLAESGAWHIPGDVSAIGDTQDVPYTSAGAWVGSSSCAPWLRPGTAALREWLYQAFPQNGGIGGYNCRAINGNSSQMSVHGTGRALDIYIPEDGGAADNGLGDPVGNWLIMHAEEIGIQYIIWDLWTWRADRADGAKDRAYGGSHPHDNHLHIELSVAGGEGQTPWFSGPQTLPGNVGCGALPAAGGTISELGACTQRFGPSAYWRYVEGSGESGQLYWTNAFEASAPSCWARQTIELTESGQYKIELFIDPTYGVYNQTRTTVRHAGQDETFFVNQGAASGWTFLGVFDFDAAGDEHLSIYDNVSGPVASDQHIVLDAIRVTRLHDPPPIPEEPPPSDPPPSDPPPSDPPPADPPPSDPPPNDPPPSDPPPADPPPADPNDPAPTEPDPADPDPTKLPPIEPITPRDTTSQNITGGCSVAGQGNDVSSLSLLLLLFGAIALRRR